MTTTFSLKQGETRTDSVPIPHPLSFLKVVVVVVEEGELSLKKKKKDVCLPFPNRSKILEKDGHLFFFF